jgi:hypothetical protein
LQELEAQPAISHPGCDFSSFDQWEGDRVFEMSDEMEPNEQGEAEAEAK